MIDLIGYWIVLTLLTLILAMPLIFIGDALLKLCIRYVTSGEKGTEYLGDWIGRTYPNAPVPVIVLSILTLFLSATFNGIYFVIMLFHTIAFPERLQGQVNWLMDAVSTISHGLSTPIGYMLLLSCLVVGLLRGLKVLYRINKKVSKLLNKRGSNDTL